MRVQDGFLGSRVLTEGQSFWSYIQIFSKHLNNKKRVREKGRHNIRSENAENFAKNNERHQTTDSRNYRSILPVLF